MNKTVEVAFTPGDKCWIVGQRFECIIESVIIESEGIRYTWYNMDIGPECDELWDDGDFTTKDIGVTVFKSYEELEKAFPTSQDIFEDYEDYEDLEWQA